MAISKGFGVIDVSSFGQTEFKLCSVALHSFTITR